MECNSSFCLHRDRNPDSGIPGDLKSDSDSSPDRDSRYGNYPPEATCGYSCKHKKTLEEDPSAFAFDEVYDDMKHRDIVPKLQDRQHLKDLVKGFQHSAPYCECRACSNSPNLSRSGTELMSYVQAPKTSQDKMATELQDK
ncbi:hypothetical protein Bca52824_083510 [Brassica carinata]|uniref:Nuclear speckle splicing regulatory protein 1 N-terminal domain-containing protein n=1 Tax=Brassica carinata TaxID=52824 RepID=A0A8X7PPK5_BRACI|nr:hypothetical protein Bca52824_083510 [Brassica carinata]